MTYPPPGGYDPQQYHVSSQPPQQPSDPYAQGYGAPPPPPGYGPSPTQYSQPQQPAMTPPIGVQPGYPPGAPSPLPPQLPPPQQGGNLGLILGVIVGLVVLLGVAAILVVPGMLEDDEEPSQAGEDPSSEAAEEPTDAPAEEEQSAEGEEDSESGGLEGWSTPVNSDDYDVNTPEGAAIAYVVAADSGDTETLESLLCSEPTDDMQWDYEYEVEYGGAGWDFLIWGMSKEVDGEIEAWAGYTMDDTAPKESDLQYGNFYTAVEEDGQWKLCDVTY